MTQRDPGRLMQIGMAFWPAKTLLSAVELGVFTALSGKALTARELQHELGLHPRGVADLLDTLVALICWPAMARRGGAIPEHGGNRSLSRPKQQRVHGRFPRDGEYATLPILGRPHRSAQDG